MSLSRPVWRSDYANSRQLSALETFSRGSTAMRTNQLGALGAAAANQPRFDFAPLSLTCRGALLEPGATNYWPRSEGPVANLNAADVTDTTMAGFSGAIAFGNNSVTRYALINTASFPASTLMCLSLYVEMDDGLAPNPGADSSATDFTLTIANSQITSGYTVTQVGPIRYRVSASGITSASPGGLHVGVYKYGGQSTRGFKVTGFDFEPGSVPTTYKPTAGAAVTRGVDSLSIADLTRIWRTEEASIVVRGRWGGWAGSIQMLFSANDGTTSNRLLAYRSAAGAVALILVVGGTTLISQQVFTGVVDGADFSLALGFKAGSLVGAFNGSQPVSLTPASIPASLTQLNIGHQLSAFQLGGWLSSIEVHARAGTVAELLEIAR